MTQLGYEPPLRLGAQILENAIALLIPDILNPFFAEIARGVQDEATVSGFIPILFDSMEDTQREEQFLRMFVTQPLRGIILCGSRLASDVLLAIIAHNNLPMVIINRTLHHPNVACVRTDMEGARGARPGICSISITRALRFFQVRSNRSSRLRGDAA
jgi:LacI family transcriptional regulator